MNLFRHLPNALTCGNLICGVYGILHASEWATLLPAYCVWAACVFDFFDGFSARLLQVSSSIGKELDSLADMVSFGVLPGLLMFHIMQSYGLEDLSYSAFLLPVASAIRLAKFNLDARQAEGFIGLPTPANALFITALPAVPFLLIWSESFTAAWIAITLLFSWLLISPIPLFALKFKSFRWADNQVRFTFLLLAVCLMAIWHVMALPLIIVLYICISLMSWGLSKG